MLIPVRALAQLRPCQHASAAKLAAGNALWLDSSKQQCLVLWHSLRQWADLIADWARSFAVDVTTVEELSAGDEVQGTGEPRAVCSRPAQRPHQMCC